VKGKHGENNNPVRRGKTRNSIGEEETKRRRIKKKRKEQGRKGNTRAEDEKLEKE
jgi:hypothetical protein